MKIILSRKGFDSANGGCPSPIIGDRFLSLPIPSHDNVSFADLSFDGRSYLELLRTWNRKNPKAKYFCNGCGAPLLGCHADPDLENGWFGQIGSAQGYLKNQGVGPGDIFLFFGRFQLADANTLTPMKDEPIIHAVYGWLEVANVLTDRDEIKKHKGHPHACEARLADKSNALYVGRCGLLPFTDYNGDNVLTLNQGKQSKTATWRMLDSLKVKDRMNHAKNPEEGIYYQGIWQELVLDHPDAEAWALDLIHNHT